jgi:hypothetical protein
MTDRLLRTVRSLLPALLATIWLSTGAAQAATYSQAGDIPEDSPFWQFLQSPQHAEYLFRVAAMEDRAIGVTCNEDVQYSPGALRLTQPVTMNEGDPYPTAGEWLERFILQGCGQIRVHNALFEVKDDGTLNVLRVVPGHSARSFSLLRDLRPLMEAAAEIENCETKTVYNTSLNIPEGYEKQHEEQQYETWFVAGCGEQRAMILRFYVDEQNNTQVRIEAQFPIQFNISESEE